MSLIDCLPHRPPMRLLEEVIEIVHGERAAARRTTSTGDFFFQGHFPGQLIVPAVILVEMVPQVGGIAIAARPDGVTAPTVHLRIAALGPFKFPAAASSMAPAARESEPIVVPPMPRSEMIRASTGNAVIDIAAPMNSTA